MRDNVVALHGIHPQKKMGFCSGIEYELQISISEHGLIDRN